MFIITTPKEFTQISRCHLLSKKSNFPYAASLGNLSEKRVLDTFNAINCEN